MPNKLTTAEFIERARKAHGDRYDYSQSEYINSSSKVLINCPKHGEFRQLAIGHIRGSGCTKCSTESRAKKKTKTTEMFVQEAREIHGEKYDYSKAEYSGQYKGVQIICSLHGQFTQDPKVHLMGSGCPECGLLTIGDKKRLSQNEFIERSKELHGDKYDYANVKYLGAHRRVKIICPTHGLFEQNPADHQRGKGCPACSGVERYGQEGFIERAKVAHGRKYDYSKVEYVNARTKVRIICPIHGEFLQEPFHHKNGVGCPGCKADNQRTRRLKSPQDFIDDAIALHGNRYDYSKVAYKGSRTNVVIACPEHGDFEQLPYAHLQDSGCPICGELAGAELRKVSNDDFIAAARKVHGNKYDYSKVEYKGAFNKVSIICSGHGDFEQAPTNHLSGNGCPECKFEKMLLNTETFIERGRKAHGNKYDYSKTEYVHGRKAVTIICPVHGIFTQKAGSHIEGRGCQSCAEHGFNPEIPGMLYYLRVTNPIRTVYKIGITNRSVEERFCASDLRIITIIKTWNYAVGRDAYKKEQAILKEHTQFSYMGVDKPLESGNTELFTRDVLGLDKDYA